MVLNDMVIGQLVQHPVPNLFEIRPALRVEVPASLPEKLLDSLGQLVCPQVASLLSSSLIHGPEPHEILTEMISCGAGPCIEEEDRREATWGHTNCPRLS